MSAAANGDQAQRGKGGADTMHKVLIWAAGGVGISALLGMGIREVEVMPQTAGVLHDRATNTYATIRCVFDNDAPPTFASLIRDERTGVVIDIVPREQVDL